MKITRTIPMMDVEIIVYVKETVTIEKQQYSLISGTDVEEFINQFDEVKYLDHHVIGEYENKIIITLNERGFVEDYTFKAIEPAEREEE